MQMEMHASGNVERAKKIKTRLLMGKPYIIMELWLREILVFFLVLRPPYYFISCVLEVDLFHLGTLI